MRAPNPWTARNSMSPVISSGMRAAPREQAPKAMQRRGRDRAPEPRPTTRRCCGGTGSHGFGAREAAARRVASHGIGVRQPSRPLNVGQNAMPYGSCSASNGTSASARPSSSPWYTQTEPRSEHTSAGQLRRRSAAARALRPQRLTTRSTSWLEIAQHGQPCGRAPLQRFDRGADVRRASCRRSAARSCSPCAGGRAACTRPSSRANRPRRSRPARPTSG